MNIFNDGCVTYTVKDIEALRAENEALRANQNKIRAQAVRDAITACSYNGSDGQGWKSDLEQYANSVEKGEL